MAIECDDHMGIIHDRTCLQKTHKTYNHQRMDGNVIHIDLHKRPVGVFYLETHGKNCLDMQPTEVKEFNIPITDKFGKVHDKFSIYRALQRFAQPNTAQSVSENQLAPVETIESANTMSLTKEEMDKMNESTNVLTVPAHSPSSSGDKLDMHGSSPYAHKDFSKSEPSLVPDSPHTTARLSNTLNKFTLRPRET